MNECKKENKIKNGVRNGISYILSILSTIIFPPIAEGAEMIGKNIEERTIRIEKRIMKNFYSFLLISFGGTILLSALFFFLIEQLSWNKTSSLFFIGIIIFVSGFLIKLAKVER